MGSFSQVLGRFHLETPPLLKPWGRKSYKKRNPETQPQILILPHPGVSHESSTLCTTSLLPELFPKFGGSWKDPPQLLPGTLGAAWECLPTTSRPSLPEGLERGWEPPAGRGRSRSRPLARGSSGMEEADPAAPREFQGGAAASPRPRQEQGDGEGMDGWMVSWDNHPLDTEPGNREGRRYTAVHTVLTVNSASPAMMSEGCRLRSYMGFSKVPLTLVFSWPA